MTVCSTAQNHGTGHARSHQPGARARWACVPFTWTQMDGGLIGLCDSHRTLGVGPCPLRLPSLSLPLWDLVSAPPQLT